MHDKVSVVDGFSFRFSSGNSFQRAESIVMQTCIVSDQISGGGEQKSLRGAPPCGRKPASDSIIYYIL